MIYTIIIYQINFKRKRNSQINKYKLPSYSDCLSADILPTNFSNLKSFYEIMIKDKEICELNKNKFL